MMIELLLTESLAMVELLLFHVLYVDIVEGKRDNNYYNGNLFGHDISPLTKIKHEEIIQSTKMKITPR